jgi:ABC-type multidrug transport system ATPase subunit
MLSSHLLTEVESIVQRVIILRRGHLGLARKLSELEAEPIIVVEVRAPADQVAGVLRGTDGVASVNVQNLGDGITACEVRTHHHKDLREVLSQRLASQHWPLRRLDLRRRSLQDRWNEINNWEEFASRPGGDGGGRGSVASTAVTT